MKKKGNMPKWTSNTRKIARRINVLTGRQRALREQWLTLDMAKSFLRSQLSPEDRAKLCDGALNG